MMYGLDYLGLPKFVDVAIKTHPDGWAAGCFAEAFGDAYSSVDKFLKKGKCPRFRVHLLWSDTHSFGDSDIPAIKKLAARYEKLALKFPDIDIEISPFCEHNVKNPDKYLEIVSHAAPHCIPVNSVWQGALSKKFKNEVHGTKPRAPSGAYNFSFDGESAYDQDVENLKIKHGSAEVFYLWGSRFNGKAQDDDNIPRPQRKEWPDKDYIKSLIYLAGPKGATGLPKNWLLKTHSEKAYKPVIIAPIKTDVILYKIGNKTVDTFKYYGQYVDGRSRYYSTRWGYEVGTEYGVIDVWAQGKFMGKANPGFRVGSFH